MAPLANIINRLQYCCVSLLRSTDLPGQVLNFYEAILTFTSVEGKHLGVLKDILNLDVAGGLLPDVSGITFFWA